LRNAPRARFEFELKDHLNQHDAEKTLRAAIEWGRYAELFSYDDEARTFGLDHSTTWPAGAAILIVSLRLVEVA
jgi:hypothetical protein